MDRCSQQPKFWFFLAFTVVLVSGLASYPGCSRFFQKVPSPQALIDSVEATYKPHSRAYQATLDVYVPTDHGQGIFRGWLRIEAADSSEIHVNRGHDEWVRLTRDELKVHRTPGKPLVEQLANINHEPILIREVFVLGPDIFSWLGDTYVYEQVRRDKQGRFVLTAHPKKTFSGVGRLEITIDPTTYHVLEVRLYAKNGDLAGRYTYHDFAVFGGYPVPRSVGVDVVERGHVISELYRLRGLRASQP